MGLIRGSFGDIDELCHTLQTWDVELTPLSRATEGEAAGIIFQAGDLDCQYMYAGFSTGLRMAGDPPCGLVTFNIQEATGKHYWWRGHDLDATMAWVFPMGGELRSVSPQGFKVHTLSVQEEEVALLAAQYGLDLPPQSQRPEVFPVPEAVMVMVRRSMNNLSQGRMTPAASAREVLRGLVPAWLGQDNAVIAQRPAKRSRDRAIRRSLEVVEAFDIAELTVQLLLDHCHVSERTLQYAFRESFGMTPAAFIKSLRMAGVRSALRNSDPARLSVGDVAAQFGFWHLSQFAEDYQRLYGELPSRTRRCG